MERGELLTLAAYERTVCSGCGWSSLTIAREHIHVQTESCEVCAEVTRFDRVLADQDQRGRGEKPAPARQDPADGRRVLTQIKRD